MNLERLRSLAGITESNHYNEPKANHPVKSGAGTATTADGKDLKKMPEMKHNHPKTSEKTGDKSANYSKEMGGKKVKEPHDMMHKKGGKGKTDEPKANHKIKLGGKEVHVKEMASALVESGDVEGNLVALIQELQEQGLDL